MAFRASECSTHTLRFFLIKIFLTLPEFCRQLFLIAEALNQPQVIVSHSTFLRPPISNDDQEIFYDAQLLSETAKSIHKWYRLKLALGGVSISTYIRRCHYVEVQISQTNNKNKILLVTKK